MRFGWWHGLLPRHAWALRPALTSLSAFGDREGVAEPPAGFAWSPDSVKGGQKKTPSL